MSSEGKEVACEKCGAKGNSVTSKCTVTVMKAGKPDSSPTLFDLCPICSMFLAVWLGSGPEETY